MWTLHDVINLIIVFVCKYNFSTYKHTLSYSIPVQYHKMGFHAFITKGNVRMMHGVLLQRKEFMQLVVKLLPQIHCLPGFPDLPLPKQLLLTLIMGMGLCREEHKSTEVTVILLTWTKIRHGHEA